VLRLSNTIIKRHNTQIMKSLLLIATLLFTWPTQQAAAQQVALTPLATAERPVPVPVDSAAVLHQLFKNERRFVLLGAAISTGVFNSINGLRSSRKAFQLIGGVGIGADAGLLVILVVDQIKFSRRREREAIEQLRHQQPLRPYVKKSYTLALAKATLPRR
jgi:hypothetical protein